MSAEYQNALRAACLKERRFQAAKHKELSYVHSILNDATLSRHEKWVSLVAIGFGAARAKEIIDDSGRTN